MEEIIGLLIVVGTLILKVVGNRLEKSGKKAAPEAVPQEEPEVDFDFKGWVREALYDAEAEAKAEEPLDQAPVVMKPEAEAVRVQPKPVKPKPVKKPVVKKPILEEEISEKKGEKIDPKKLVIYSEIMKPKFTE
jgi:hypothetical protein